MSDNLSRVSEPSALTKKDYGTRTLWAAIYADDKNHFLIKEFDSL